MTSEDFKLIWNALVVASVWSGLPIPIKKDDYDKYKEARELIDRAKDRMSEIRRSKDD